MGLMDRDYYREKKKNSDGGNLIEKLKSNPLIVIALIAVLLILLSVLL
ncbi:hypothetical protein BCF55_1144 [Hydrogenivirga caldilitoris]|uniref:Uncharacterized protein n=1 Tax=Hydrogenivirga caldilitoris TaxID=246264 RepID=A0A497XRY7_9AQUI|nr:hypothetical protein [Hydrogenivirga caldilitoris]RLJ70859.1 hypothetical protein BCF55_1144 [Hydrogenivirga caldilitoris]